MRLGIMTALLAVAIGMLWQAPNAEANTPAFQAGTLNFSMTQPTSLAFGPDGRLYVASQTEIKALTLGASGLSVTSTENIASGQNQLIGIAFDPTVTSPVRIYASRREPSATDGYEGRVSTFTAPTWTRADVITGLPNSTPFTNHYTNGFAFDNAGVLYIAQGSNTDAGLAGPNYPETPLTAAILRADVGAPGFDGTITYSPAGIPTDDNVDQTGGDVTVFAPGTRNPYDLAYHSNGKIYATDNGPAGPNTSVDCTTSGTGVSSADELNLIEEDNYYGFPNRNRGRTDPRQCTYHSPAEGSGANFTGPIHTFAAHCSCDGIAEFKSNVFNSKMQGDLVIAQLIFGNVVRADLAPNGESVLSVTTLQSGYTNPLDIAISPTGVIYIAEYGANRIAYLTPAAVGGEASISGVAVGAGSGTSNMYVLLAAAGVSAAGFALWTFARRSSRENPLPGDPG